MASRKSILLPFGENTRYDLLIDEGDRFVRVQCKTGAAGRAGSDRVSTASTYDHHARCSRVTPPANGQRPSIRWAEEFELGRAPLLG
jgi:hypothetical protein